MKKEDYWQIESSQKQHHEIMRHQSDINYHVEREEFNLFALLKPKIYQDGSQWCVLLGEDAISGICGFGETPRLAIYDFNKSFDKKQQPKVKDKISIALDRLIEIQGKSIVNIDNSDIIDILKS